MTSSSDSLLAGLRHLVDSISPKAGDIRRNLSNCLKALEQPRDAQPADALALARAAAESLTCDVLKALGHRPPHDFVDCVNLLRDDRVSRGMVPPEMVSTIDVIRKRCNPAVHRRGPRQPALFNSLLLVQSLLALAEWYCSEFARGPRLSPFYEAAAPEPAHIPVPSLFSGSFSSRFANTEADLEAVLGLRRAFFGSQVIVPDESYRRCWRRNPDSMKLVFDFSKRPVGYWSVIPVSRASFSAFVENRCSHEEMLTRHCVGWDAVDPGAAFLYVVGAVVPPEGAAGQGYAAAPSILSSRVLLDLFSFADLLSCSVAVRGVCGYPSRTGGRQILKKLGFAESGGYVGGDSRQPVCYYDEGRMRALRNLLSHYLSGKSEAAPEWDKDDRDRFFSILPAPA